MNEETKIWVISVDEDPMPWEYWDLPHSVFTGTEKDAESYRLGLEANNPKEWIWSMVSTQVDTIQSSRHHAPRAWIIRRLITIRKIIEFAGIQHAVDRGRT